MRFWLVTLLLSILCWSCQPDQAVPDLIPFVNESNTESDSLLQLMTLEEKLGQLLFWEVDTLADSTLVVVQDRLVRGQFGGLLFNHIPYDSFLLMQDSLRPLAPIDPWIGTKEQLLLNNQFSDAAYVPTKASVKQMQDDSLHSILEQIFAEQLATVGFNWAPLLLEGSESGKRAEKRRLDQLSDQRILSPLCHLPGHSLAVDADSVKMESGVLKSLAELHQLGLPAIFLDTVFFSQLNIPPTFVQSFFRKQLNYNGLIFGDFGRQEGMADLIAAGVDVFWVKDGSPERALEALKESIDGGLLSMEEVDQKVRRVLQAKQWQHQSMIPVEEEEILPNEAALAGGIALSSELDEEEDTSQHLPIVLADYFQHPFWEYWREEVYMEAVCVVNNFKDLIPFTYTYKRNFNLIHTGNEQLKTFDKAFGRYGGYTLRQLRAMEGDTLPAIESFGSNRTYVVTTQQSSFDPIRDSAFVASLHALGKNNKLALVYFGDPTLLAGFDTSMTIIQVPDLNPTTERLTAELLFGAVPSYGKLPVAVNDYYPAGTGVELPVVRLQYNSPSSVGVSPEKLVGIDAIANTAIKDQIIPGCQVLVAKAGKVIYHKSFGHHTFSKRRRVSNAHLYDIASISKVAGTTLAAMRLYDQGKFKLNSTLQELGLVGANSSLKKVQVRKLLTHESGLQPFMPVIPYLLHRDEGNAACDSFFCKSPSEQYDIHVADSFYFQSRYIDSVWAAVEELPLRRSGRFRYSDANFMLVQKLVEKLSDRPLDEYLEMEFYHALGLQKIRYQPLEEFDRNQIIPTEEDERWRQGLVHGFVHDETAALFGGVAGHAGLFSTANDLAVLGQLLLNKGSYGGREYLSPETVKLFTRAQYGTHRGLGFDTADPRSRSAFSRVIPKKTFGHTGFTGTCFWVDPENELVYVFLSNRLHPSAKNRRFLRKRIRERIQRVIYDALETEENSWPELALLQRASLESSGDD